MKFIKTYHVYIQYMSHSSNDSFVNTEADFPLYTNTRVLEQNFSVSAFTIIPFNPCSRLVAQGQHFIRSRSSHERGRISSPPVHTVRDTRGDDSLNPLDTSSLPPPQLPSTESSLVPSFLVRRQSYVIPMDEQPRNTHPSWPTIVTNRLSSFPRRRG